MNIFTPQDFEFIAYELGKPETKVKDIFGKTYLAQKTIFAHMEKDVSDGDRDLDGLFLTQEEADESAWNSRQRESITWVIYTTEASARCIVSDYSRRREKEATLRLLVEILDKSGAPYTFYDLLNSPTYEHLFLSRSEGAIHLLTRLKDSIDDETYLRSVPELASEYDHSRSASIRLATEVAGNMLLHRHPRYIQLASQIRTHISENPDTEIQDIDKLIKQVSETVAELVLGERSEVSQSAVLDMVRAIYGDAYNDLPIITNTFSDPPVQVTKQNIPYGFFQKALFKIAPSRFNYTYTEYNMLRYPELERLADELTDFLKNWIEEELK